MGNDLARPLSWQHNRISVITARRQPSLSSAPPGTRCRRFEAGVPVPPAGIAKYEGCLDDALTISLECWRRDGEFPRWRSHQCDSGNGQGDDPKDNHAVSDCDQ